MLEFSVLQIPVLRKPFPNVADFQPETFAVITKNILLNRKSRREKERQKPKRVRKLDWKKIKNEFFGIFKIMLIFIFILTAFLYYITKSNNNLTSKISENPVSISGIIVSINEGKFSNANYEFEVNNKKYFGSTNDKIQSGINQYICIEYYKSDPNLNLYCNDLKLQCIFDNVILFSLKIFGIMLILNICIVFWKILIKDKKVIIEITSKK